MQPKYTILPSLALWKIDRDGGTSVSDVLRRYRVRPELRDTIEIELRAQHQADTAMQRIEELLGANAQVEDAAEQSWLLFDLYQALEYWLKTFRPMERPGGANRHRVAFEQYVQVFEGLRKGAVFDLFIRCAL